MSALVAGSLAVLRNSKNDINIQEPAQFWNTLPDDADISAWKSIFYKLLTFIQPGHLANLTKFINQDLYERPANFLFRLSFRHLYVRLLVQNQLCSVQILHCRQRRGVESYQN